MGTLSTPHDDPPNMKIIFSAVLALFVSATAESTTPHHRIAELMGHGRILMRVGSRVLLDEVACAAAEEAVNECAGAACTECLMSADGVIRGLRRNLRRDG